MSIWSKLGWVADRTPLVSNVKGLAEGNKAQAILGPAAHIKGDVNEIGQMTGLGPTPSEQEKQDLAQQRNFRDQMLAALQARLGTPLQAPQLGAPSWAGYQTPMGPGTTSSGMSNAPVVSRMPAMVPSAAAVPAAQNSNPVLAELERIRRQKLLSAYGNSTGLRLG